MFPFTAAPPPIQGRAGAESTCLPLQNVDRLRSHRLPPIPSPFSTLVSSLAAAARVRYAMATAPLLDAVTVPGESEQAQIFFSWGPRLRLSSRSAIYGCQSTNVLQMGPTEAVLQGPIKRVANQRSKRL
ncbi:unnamed protein product [Urochloa humidicola]